MSAGLGYTVEQVNAMTLVEMLRIWRTAPVGTIVTGDPASDRLGERLREARQDPDQGAAWVAASKEVGW